MDLPGWESWRTYEYRKRFRNWMRLDGHGGVSAAEQGDRCAVVRWAHRLGDRDLWAVAGELGRGQETTELAEREGFEPSVEGLPLHVISSPKPGVPEPTPPHLTCSDDESDF